MVRVWGKITKEGERGCWEHWNLCSGRQRRLSKKGAEHRPAGAEVGGRTCVWGSLRRGQGPPGRREQGGQGGSLAHGGVGRHGVLRAMQGLGLCFSHERPLWGFWKVVIAAYSDIFSFSLFILGCAGPSFLCCRGWVCALVEELGLQSVQASVVAVCGQ